MAAAFMLSRLTRGFVFADTLTGRILAAKEVPHVREVLAQTYSLAIEGICASRPRDEVVRRMNDTLGRVHLVTGGGWTQPVLEFPQVVELYEQLRNSHFVRGPACDAHRAPDRIDAMAATALTRGMSASDIAGLRSELLRCDSRL